VGDGLDFAPATAAGARGGRTCVCRGRGQALRCAVGDGLDFAPATAAGARGSRGCECRARGQRPRCAVGGGLARVSATAMWSASAPIGRSVARLPQGSALASQGVDTDEGLSKGRTEFDEQAHINICEAEDARITRNSQSVIHSLDAQLRSGGQRLAGNDWGSTIGWKSLSSGCLANGTWETVATTSHISQHTVSSFESESSRLRDQVIP